MRREKIHIDVDDATIAGGDLGAIIEPVWWLSTVYDGPVAYELSLERFSQSQRIVRAVLLYISEVNNGGHRQFYANSSGIVWRDALAGFEAIGELTASRIITLSAERMGCDPSLDRQERNEQLATLAPDFRDLDEAFYELQQRVNFNQMTMNFVRTRPSDFYFSGTIERVVLPSFA